MTDVLLDRWWSAMLAVSWQFTLLFAVVAIAIAIMGPRFTPAVRHNLWLVVLLRLALPIGLEAPFGLAPRPQGWFERVAGKAAAATRPAELEPGLPRPTVGARSTRRSEVDTRGLAESGRLEPVSAPRRPSAIATRARRALFSIWCAGLVAMMALQVRRMRRHPRVPIVPVERAPEPLRSAMRRASDALGLRRPPRVAIADDPALDIRVAGVLEPRLLVPARMARDWSSSELEPVLLHELAHVRRADPLTRALANVLQASFFFHPLVWVVARRLAVERELACDDAAARGAGSRRYADALLRVAAQRLGPPRDRFALSVRGGAVALRSRLDRMLDADYRPAARTSRGAIAALAVALAIGAGASVYGERAEPPTGRDAERHVGYVFHLHEVFDVNSIDEVIDGAGKPYSGDYERRGAVRTSIGAIKKKIDTQQLRRLLAADPEPRLVYRLVIDPAGRVVDVSVTEAPPGAAVTQVQTELRSLVLQPAVHRSDGKAVFLTLDATVFLEPEPSSRLDLVRKLVGGELAGEVVDLYAVPQQPGVAVPTASFYEHPPYVRIASRPPAPSGIAASSHGIYSLSFELDADGHVHSMQPIAYQPATELYPRSDADAAPPETVRRWVESFVLDSVPGLGAESSTLRGLVDIEVREGSASVLTHAPATVDAVRSTIAESYRLAPDRNLDLAPGPRSSGGTLLYRFGVPLQARYIAEGPTLMTVYIDQDGRAQFGGAAFGCHTLGDLLRTIGWDPNRVHGDPELLEQHVPADLVLRRGVQPSDLLTDLARALRERVGIAVDLDVRDEPRDTIVLRGSFGTIAPDPDPDPESHGLPTVHVYADRRDDGGGGSATGPAATVLPLFLSHALGLPVVDETTGPSPVVHVELHRSARDTEHVDAVLRNLERETGIAASIEQRPTQTLQVTAGSDPQG